MCLSLCGSARCWCSTGLCPHFIFWMFDWNLLTGRKQTFDFLLVLRFNWAIKWTKRHSIWHRNSRDLAISTWKNKRTLARSTGFEAFVLEPTMPKMKWKLSKREKLLRRRLSFISFLDAFQNVQHRSLFMLLPEKILTLNHVESPFMFVPLAEVRAYQVNSHGMFTISGAYCNSGQCT